MCKSRETCCRSIFRQNAVLQYLDYHINIILRNITGQKKILKSHLVLHNNYTLHVQLVVADIHRYFFNYRTADAPMYYVARVERAGVRVNRLENNTRRNSSSLNVSYCT